MEIVILKTVDLDVVASFQNLLPQLDTNSRFITKEILEQIIQSENTTLLIAKDHLGKIIGTLSLVSYCIPTGNKYWIEDVVVDNNYRGQGIGKQLLENALELARKKGALKIDLTSNAKRLEAHQLYKKVGFIQRQTSVFRNLISK